MLLFRLAVLCRIVLVFQRVLYNGHKKVHAIKFQSVAVPNGLVANLFSPGEGKRHDSSMLSESNLYNQLVQYAVNINGDPLCIYGDPAYPHRPQLQGPFKGARLTQNEKDWNSAMSSVRVSVEWIFKDIINCFKFLDFKKNLKVQLSAVGKMYIVCTLLHNAAYMVQQLLNIFMFNHQLSKTIFCKTVNIHAT